jgi:hypothetical protein
MKRFLLILLAIVVVAAIAGGAYASYMANQNLAAPLTGFSVSHSLANRRPIGVMIDNYSPDARPQSGLSQADLVFETLAEGGITRFLPVFQSHDAAMIGPVRSTRLYFNTWAAALGLIFGHDGGNVDALQQLPTLTSIFNVDANRVSGPYWRISSRLAPHNEYTSTTGLRNYAASHGGATTGVAMSLPHKNDAALSQRPNSFTLTIAFSGPDYSVTWQYDRGANDYLRSMGGSPHVDQATGKQITAKNVVVMYTTQTSAYDPFTPGSIHLGTVGSNKAVVYEDGTAVQGTWHVASLGAPLQWLDSHGNTISLNKGNTWLEVVPIGTSVTTS